MRKLSPSGNTTTTTTSKCLCIAPCVLITVLSTSSFHPHELCEVGIVILMLQMKEWRLNSLPKNIQLAWGRTRIQGQASLVLGSKLSTIMIATLVVGQSLDPQCKLSKPPSMHSPSRPLLSGMVATSHIWLLST